MLVLKRRIGELIRIGDEIVIHVVEVCDGSAVRLGIDAPRSVPVHREEVYVAIHGTDGTTATTPEAEPVVVPCRFCGRQKYRIQLVGGLCRQCHRELPE